MAEKVLFVDDDPNILSAYKRHLRKQYRIDTAAGGPEGLAIVKKHKAYSVVVSDMNMPGMNGVEFLCRVRDIAPDTVRIMLTGNADQQTAINAVNEGHIFRFLNKPCNPDLMIKTLDAAVRQYQLITAERDLLRKTLAGSIKILTDVLTLVNPAAFGRSSRIKRYARQIAERMSLPNAWQVETAASLSQIGCVILPEDILNKIYQGKKLTENEEALVHQHPATGSSLLGNIPRMAEIARTIEYQEKRFDGSGVPRDACSGEDIPVGARILKVVLDFDTLQAPGGTQDEALATMRQRDGWYDPVVLVALENVVGVEGEHDVESVDIKALKPGMVLTEDVRTASGLLLISRGQEVSATIIERLRYAAKDAGITGSIRVLVPKPQDSPKAAVA